MSKPIDVPILSSWPPPLMTPDPLVVMLATVNFQPTGMFEMRFEMTQKVTSRVSSSFVGGYSAPKSLKPQLISVGDAFRVIPSTPSQLLAWPTVIWGKMKDFAGASAYAAVAKMALIATAVFILIDGG